ncbi:DinB family protein [Alkalicoccobacillus porphyridii]|uniref:DinB family protein n=1 Tax=Alkalicoccobacillus porphyridii TaxID=2597270 RepID=A0A553ZVT7_9BACI|nr:DinB family protein [Alkalicoccobacillus porphyridii]TSB45543.1 DinB family protein [Alkalicoccobacillus porphyridii]
MSEMKSGMMLIYFNQLSDQRETFLSSVVEKDVWQRPLPEKWSIGETMYHLLLLLKRFRQINVGYLHLAKPLAHLNRQKSFKTESENIYEHYQQHHSRAMKAPPFIKPPSKLQEKITYKDMITELNVETRKLKSMLSNIDENIAGHIRYPDPPAHYPNLIQAIHLLVIHEQHHFKLCETYYKETE